MTRRQLIGLSPFAALAVLLLAKPAEPYVWGHGLSEACQWSELPSASLLGDDDPDASAAHALARCWARHGAHAPGPIPAINLLLTSWPSAAQLAAWNGDTR